MTEIAHLGFTKKYRELTDAVFVPKYYHPGVESSLGDIYADIRYAPITIGDLEKAGHLEVANGHDLLKLEYGTGSIPYVRTSDLGTWEIATTPKHGVDGAVYAHYAARQDVSADDILFVKDGTYLVGKSAMIAPADLPLVYQSHLYRFRLSDNAPLESPLLLLLLSTEFVRRQVRSRQFAAGIIDKIEDRYRELVLPVPAHPSDRTWATAEVRRIVERRVELREQLRLIPIWAQGIIDEPHSVRVSQRAGIYETSANLGFTKTASELGNGPLIPKYHDPAIDRELQILTHHYELRSIQDLVQDGLLSITTGIEVGKMAYGTGEIPFVRTSDLSNWELKSDIKQRVSEDIYVANKPSCDAAPFDILLVRDGTYLVGTSAILTKDDGRLLFAGGVYRIRVLQPNRLDPFLLLALMNTPIVKRQIRAKQFTRDIIDTLGRRLLEIQIPIPRDSGFARRIGYAAGEAVMERAQLRHEAADLASALMEHPPSQRLRAFVLGMRKA